MRLLLVFLMCCSVSRAQNDGFKEHLVAGAVISGGTGLALYKLTDRPLISLGIGFAAGGGAGELKERVYDRMLGKGTYSNQDRGATWWGSANGMIILSIGIDLDLTRRQKKKDQMKINP